MSLMLIPNYTIMSKIRANTSKFNFEASTSFVSNTTDILDDLLKNGKKFL